MMRHKRLTTKNNGCADDDVLTPILDDDSVCKILSKLPVKSLVRFKCVCKSWQSLIQSDPYFVDLHLTQSKKRPVLLIRTSYYQQGELPGTKFYLADLSQGTMDGGGRGVASYITTTPWDHDMLQPVNGLVCFVHYEEKAVHIYNLSTREKTGWIKTPIHERQKSAYDHPTWYGFGFDPVINKHKVICVSLKDGDDNEPNLYTDPNDQVCDVLTVGQKSWRRIAAVPPLNIHGNSFYVNGIMYWPSIIDYTGAAECSIVAFDVASEKFRVIPNFPVPNLILDDPPPPVERFTSYDYGFLEVDDRLALSVLGNENSKTISIWIYDDVKKEQKKKNTSSGWTEETISLPFDPKLERLNSLESIAGTDLILLATNKMTMESIPSIYYYDREKKSTTTYRGDVKLNDDGSYDGGVTVLVESLFHVQP